MQQPSSAVSIKRTFAFNSINKVGGFLGALGIRPFKLDAQKMLAKVCKKVNYKGEMPPQVLVGLEKLIASINQEAKVNTFGSLALKNVLERSLYNRLKVEQELAKNPSIEQVPITRPIFIIGMPRTGTTILHALLQQDPMHRAPLAWECLLPYPVSTPATYANNPQLQTIQKEFSQLFQLVPDFQKKHYLEANSPQECLGINALDFNSFQTAAQVYIPSYMQWFNEESSQLQTMQFHKRFLQYLQSGGVPSEHWLLKSPVHLLRLKEIFEVYPDACIIMTHRHPAKVVPSAASLVSSVRSLYSDQESAEQTGTEQAAIWSSYFERFLAARQELNKEEQIIDLRFEDFVQNQLGVVQQIYDHFGWDLSSAAKSKMQQFLAQNPKDKHGAHQYTLQDFGLTQQGIEQQFKTYIDFLEQLS